MLDYNNSSPHPTSSGVSRVVETFAGGGEKVAASVLEGEEVAVGGVAATDRERTALVCGDVDSLTGAGQEFWTVGEEVAERAVAAVGATYYP